jgi:hypothetical protein
VSRKARTIAAILDTDIRIASLRNGTIASIKEIVLNLNKATLDPSVGE